MRSIRRRTECYRRAACRDLQINNVPSRIDCNGCGGVLYLCRRSTEPCCSAVRKKTVFVVGPQTKSFLRNDKSPSTLVVRDLTVLCSPRSGCSRPDNISVIVHWCA